MYSVNETIEAKFLLLHPTTGLPVTGATVVSTLYDETDTIHSYPTVTEIGNGLYTASFVPDTAGEWTIIFVCSTPVQSGGLTFPVGLGMCKDIEDKVDDIIANNVGSTVDDSFTLANSTDEQDAVTLTLTARTKIYGVDLDVSNLTQPTTFRIYRKVDGTNYRLADTYNWSSSDPDVVFIQTPFAYDEDVKITIQSSVVEGATRAIPYKIVQETMD